MNASVKQVTPTQRFVDNHLAPLVIYKDLQSEVNLTRDFSPQCLLCTGRYPSQWLLKEHMKAQHPGYESAFRNCPAKGCDFFSMTKISMIWHQHFRHQGKKPNKRHERTQHPVIGLEYWLGCRDCDYRACAEEFFKLHQDLIPHRK